MWASEPSEDCPVHGYPWPPRCETCGQYMKWPQRGGFKDIETIELTGRDKFVALNEEAGLDFPYLSDYV